MYYNLFLGEGVSQCQIKHFCREMNRSNEYYSWQLSTLNFAKREFASSESFKEEIMQDFSGNIPKAHHFSSVGSAMPGLVSSLCFSI